MARAVKFSFCGVEHPHTHRIHDQNDKLSHTNTMREPSGLAKGFAHAASVMAHDAGKPLTFVISVTVI